MPRFLFIEDVEVEVDLTLRNLAAGGVECTWRRVETESELHRALSEFDPDLILSDFALPRFNGLEALGICTAVSPHVPFIFLSGTIGEERAIEALRKGAVDYVLKGNRTRLVPAIRRALEEASLRRARRAAETRVTRLMRILQMISAINTAVVRIRTRAELLQEAARISIDVGGYTQALFALIDPHTRAGTTAAYAGIDEAYLRNMVFPVSESAADDTSMTGRTLRSGQICVCQELRTYDGPIENRARLLGQGIRSIASLPLTIDGTPVGAFCVATTEGGTFDQEELQMLQELTANVAFALQFAQKNDELEFLSYFDPLTRLAKRALFCERLTRMLGKEEIAPNASLSIAALDIERLSVLNDSFGRHVGDQFLESVADRLRQEFGNTDHLAHLGGGTFAIVLLAGAAAGGELRSLHGQIERLFVTPLLVGHREIPVAARFGFSQFPQNGLDARTLLENAEAALHIAKESGEKYLYHRLEMNSDVAESLALEHRLRTALDNEEFVLHYQPKVDARSGRVVGLEALLRWNDPERGLIAPGAFLPTLESTGMIAAAGDWVVRQAATDCRRLQAACLPAMRIAVNVSPLQMRRRDFPQHFLEMMGTGFETGFGLDVEITEGALLVNSDHVTKQLQVLRASGVKIAIDDFGTGYSSLSRLAQLPIDTLKIDRSFTCRLGVDEAGDTVVATIIRLATAFRMTTCAEGVETPEQLAQLVRLQCDEAQGFLLSRPVSVEQLESLLIGARCVLKPAAARFDANNPLPAAALRTSN